MAQTLAQVQIRLALLYASYDAMATLPIHSYTAPQRAAQKHKMKELREEILAWEAVETELGGESTGEGGVSLAWFTN